MDPAPPSLEFTHERSVDATHIDLNGHVNNVVFVQWMQDLAVLHWKSVNGTFVQERENATWVARSHQIEYLKPAFLGDQVTMRTWVVDTRRVRSTRRYEFRRGDTLLARGETDWVFVDLTTGRPRKLPTTFTDLFNFDDTSTGRSADKQTPINTSRR